MDPRVAAIVEDAQAYLPARPSTLRLDAGDVVLRHVPHSPFYWYGSATRPRFAPETVDRRISDVRSWFGERGRAEFMWMIGESATPPDLVARLRDTGATIDPDDPETAAMVLESAPPMGPAEIEVRRIATLEDYAQSMRVVLEHASPEVWAETEANLAAAWDEARLDDTMYSFLALRAGAPIATGQLVWLTNGVPYLGGATTAASARGQGAFRALVRARWDEVASRGTPLLLVQAGVMSAPILDRLGFRRTGRIVVLRDHSA